MEFQDYYAVLGVPRTADEKQIKSAYRKHARKYHPESSKDAGAEEQFKRASEAYEVLSDSEKRAQYDKYGQAWQQYPAQERAERDRPERGRFLPPVHRAEGGSRTEGFPAAPAPNTLTSGRGGGFSDFLNALRSAWVASPASVGAAAARRRTRRPGRGRGGTSSRSWKSRSRTPTRWRAANHVSTRTAPRRWR